MPNGHRHLTLAAAVLTAALAAPAAAHATTICFPTFHAACPNNGTNVAQSNILTALGTSGNDGQKDTIIIPPGQVTTPDSYETAGTDDLEIIGAGPPATSLTTSSTANIYVVNFALGAREVTMRDLTVVVPAGMPDGQGAALQVSGGLLENVDVETRNPGAAGVVAPSGTTFRGGELRGASGGTFSQGFSATGANPTPLVIEDTVVRNASIGVAAFDDDVPVHVRRSTIVEPAGVAVSVAQGGDATVENTVITTSGTGRALRVSSNAADPASLAADHLTVIGLGGTTATAVDVEVVNNVGNGDATLSVRNSIVRGYVNTLRRVAPNAGNVGDAHLTVAFSNVSSGTTTSGNGQFVTTSNLAGADPLFASASDLRLRPGSPSIDAGDPAGGGLATDLLGLTRPKDGDGDGVARRDQGAYEYQPPAPDPGPAPGPDPVSPPFPAPAPPAGPTPAPAADTRAPAVSRLRVHRALSHRRGGAVHLTLSEPARLELRFTRRTRTVTVRAKGRAGRNTVKVPRRRLARGTWRLTVVAVDAAGNRSATAARRIRITR